MTEYNEREIGIDAGSSQVGQRIEGVSSGLRVGHGNLPAEQRLAGRGEVFLSKLTDADGENGETDSWLDFARDCGYVAAADHARLVDQARQIGAMLGAMLNDPSSFLIKSR